MWSILASISTLALSLDFGGAAYLASRLDPQNRRRPFFVAATMSCGGTAAVGLLSIAAWIPFSRTDAGGSFTFFAGFGAIVTIIVGSALRSVIQLQAQIALFDRRFGLRNAILLGHAGVALLVVLLILPSERTAWALPIGWLAAGVAGTLVGVASFWHRPTSAGSDDWEIEVSQVPSSGTYAWARTVANLCRGFLMQADRWIVGAIGGPAALAAYEVAWRVAALPRFLAENLTFVIGLDAARVRASSPEELTNRVRLCIRFTLLVLVAGSAAACGFYGLLPTVANIEPAWFAFGLLLITHGALATTAPISFIGNGIGMPKIDLPYLILAVSICALAAVLSHFFGDVNVFIVGAMLAVFLGNLWFWRYGMKAIRGASQT